MRRREREVVEPDEIRDIIEACKVCRLGFCEEGEVYIVPVNFGCLLYTSKPEGADSV